MGFVRLLVLLFLCSCQKYEDKNIPKEFVANSKSQGDVALVMTASDEDGRAENAERMWEIVSDKRIGFDITDKQEDLTKDQIIRLIKKYAAKVAPEGTLLLYLNAHGNRSGYIALGPRGYKDGKITVEQILMAIRSVRATRLRRLIFIVDSCFSGKLIEGAESIEGVFSEALFLASAGPTELSSRDTLTRAFATSLSQAADMNPTIRQFLQIVSRHFGKNGTVQTMSYELYPDDRILDEKLFIKMQ